MIRRTFYDLNNAKVENPYNGMGTHSEMSVLQPVTNRQGTGASLHQLEIKPLTLRVLTQTKQIPSNPHLLTEPNGISVLFFSNHN